MRYRIRILERRAGSHYWVIEQSGGAGWSKVGLYDDHMEGWSLTRGSAQRRAIKKLGRYLARAESFDRSQRGEVVLVLTAVAGHGSAVAPKTPPPDGLS